jgi:hypothetical protein
MPAAASAALIATASGRRAVAEAEKRLPSLVIAESDHRIASADV